MDVGHRLGQLNEAWRFFGADEPNYATMPNGHKLIGELDALRHGDTFFRTPRWISSPSTPKALLRWLGPGAQLKSVEDGFKLISWKAMGFPSPLSSEQTRTLQAAAQLKPSSPPQIQNPDQGIDVQMPRNSVVLLLVEAT